MRMIEAGNFGKTVLIVAIVAMSSVPLFAQESTPANKIEFGRDIRPILSENCFICHGPDANKREADLRLDQLEGLEELLAKDGDLLARITSTDPDEVMPPPKSKLKVAEIDTLKQWIAQGAHFQQHWSFTRLKPQQPPALKHKSGRKNIIDDFILARLQREKLSFSKEATKETLIRRLSFDLTGLPPTLEEIDAFLNDRSLDAYEKLVDRLLEKTAYGERMAINWLDLARYSDTYGYQVDRDRFVWPWKDWVIKAFNGNMAYDQFITWQLAGDLLPNATDEQILATTFNRLHPQKVEGGSVPEEFRTEYVADRNHTFGTAFLGLALECARCHDHKYDPITQKEYYQLFAFFNNIDEAGLYSFFTQSVPTPTLLLADENAKKNNAAVEQEIVRAERLLKQTAESRREAFFEWLKNRPGKSDISGRVADHNFEEHKGGANQSVPGRVGKAVKLTGDDEMKLKVGNFHRFDPFSVSLWMNTPDIKDRAVVFHRSRAWTDAGSRGYQLLIENGKLSASLIHFWPGNAIRVRTKNPVPTNKWLHVTITYDGSSRADGLTLFVNGQPADCEIVRDNLTKNITGGGGDNISIGARFRDRGFTNGLIDEFQVFNRRLSAVEVSQLHDEKSLTAALQAPLAELTDPQKNALFEYYLSTLDAEYQKQSSALRELREKRSQTVDGISEIMVMRERSNTRQTYLLRRGAYDAPTDPVEANTPAAFPPFPRGESRNRLGLARWLTDPGHPLTARVAVNYFWQHCFGDGLVGTPNDFGSQGAPPTHPELLDWLARDFLDHGWNVKRLMKMMVMSATYRQVSTASEKLRARDPENKLLARAPKYRIPAEMIRDNALAVSGLLVKTSGGPPVKPYEVAVSFKPVGRDKGPGLYRRSLYTFWKRTAPAPVMMSLDASKRDVCSVKRERTSSPLQAFVLLNDPQFVEAARILAQNMLKKHGEMNHALVDEMFRVLTSRRPSTQERDILIKLYQEQLADFEQNVDKAKTFLKTGDAPLDESLSAPRLAAAAVLASALMNFDDCVTKP